MYNGQTRLYEVLMGNGSPNISGGTRISTSGSGGGSGSPLDFFKKRGKSIENALGTTGSAIADIFKTKTENLATEQSRKDNKTRMNEVAKKYGYDNYHAVWDAMDQAEASGDQETLDKIKNVINPELQAVANENKAKADKKAADYQDYRENSYVGQKINQDRGKFAGSAINTLSTGVDVASMVAGGPANPLINTLQGGVEGLADELEESGFQNFNKERALSNMVSGAAAGLATGGLNKAIGGRNLIPAKGKVTELAGKALNSGIGRGAMSGAVGGAVGAGTSAALNGQDIIGSAVEGAKQGAIGGAVAGGVIGGANRLTNAALNKFSPETAQKMQNNAQAWEKWKNSGSNFDERLTNTLTSGESGVGNWIQGKQSKTLGRIGDSIGNRVQDVSGATGEIDNIWNKKWEESADTTGSLLSKRDLDNGKYVFSSDDNNINYQFNTKPQADSFEAGAKMALLAKTGNEPAIEKVSDWGLRADANGKVGGNYRVVDSVTKEPLFESMPNEMSKQLSLDEATAFADGYNAQIGLRNQYADSQTNINRLANGVANELEETPTTAGGWLKKAGSRALEDLNNKGVGLSIKDYADMGPRKAERQAYKDMLSGYNDNGMEGIIENLKAVGRPDDTYFTKGQKLVEGGDFAITPQDAFDDLKSIYGDSFKPETYLNKDGSWKYKNGEPYVWTTYKNKIGMMLDKEMRGLDAQAARVDAQKLKNAQKIYDKIDADLSRKATKLYGVSATDADVLGNMRLQGYGDEADLIRASRQQDFDNAPLGTVRDIDANERATLDNYNQIAKDNGFDSYGEAYQRFTRANPQMEPNGENITKWIQQQGTNTNVEQRLNELRQAIDNENISYGELAELQNYKPEILEMGDARLAEVAGIPEEEFRAYQDNTPTTAKGWLKQAGKRALEDINDKGVGLSLKKVDNLSDADLDKILSEYGKTYDKLYNSQADTLDDATYFDEVLMKDPQAKGIVQSLVARRNDAFSSDREAAALAQTLNKLGYTKSGNTSSQFPTDIQNMQINNNMAEIPEAEIAPTRSTVESTPETQVYRALQPQAEVESTYKPMEMNPDELMYGESQLGNRTRRGMLADTLERFGNTLEGAQTNVTRAAEKDLGIESAGKVVENVRKKTGLTNLETQAKLANEITGGENSLMDSVQRQALSASEDGKGYKVDTTPVLNEVESIVDKYADTNMFGSLNARSKFISNLKGDIANLESDVLTIANRMKANAADLRGKGVVDPKPVDAAKARIYTEIANKLDDISYKSIPQDNIDAMFDATISEMRGRANQATRNGNSDIANAYNRMADNLDKQPRTAKAYRSFKKDFVDVSKVAKLTARAENGAAAQMGRSFGGGLKRFASTFAQRPTNAALAKVGGAVNSFADRIEGNRTTGGNIGRNITPETPTPTTPNGRVPSQAIWNEIGRTEGTTQGEQARTANYLANAVNNQNANAQTLEDFAVPSTNSATSVYDSMYGTAQQPMTETTTQTQQNSYFPATGDYWTDILGVALTSAIDANDGEAFATLYGMYQDAAAQAAKSAQGNSGSNEKLTDTQRRAYAAENALSELATIEPDAAYNLSKIPVIGDIATMGGNQYKSATNSLATQIGYMLSGANITPAEAERIGNSYVPQPFDNETVRQQKLQRASNLIQRYKSGYAEDYSNMAS